MLLYPEDTRENTKMINSELTTEVSQTSIVIVSTSLLESLVVRASN